ncbi:methylamine utilization protein [Neptunicella marina]|nr:methylamine utilization protein [Neptunicella marina]
MPLNAASFHVQDQHGNSLAHAVIELAGSKQDTTKSQLPIAVMDQVDKQFAPQVLLIQQGQSVQFPNSDDIRHHVYSFSRAKPFELKLYAGKPKAPIPFEHAGVAVLGCNIHDSMVGYIYIAQSEHAVMTDLNGDAQLDADPDQSVYVWHSLSVNGAESRKKVTLSTLNSKEGAYILILNTAEPKVRDTFGDKFQLQ